MGFWETVSALSDCSNRFFPMEDITNGWNKLSLSDREGGEFKFQAQHKSQEFSIMAKFFTPRALNVQAVAHTFNTIWRSKNGF